jgi:hypothetical protein
LFCCFESGINEVRLTIGICPNCDFSVIYLIFVIDCDALRRRTQCVSAPTNVFAARLARQAKALGRRCKNAASEPPCVNLPEDTELFSELLLFLPLPVLTAVLN